MANGTLYIRITNLVFTDNIHWVTLLPPSTPFARASFVDAGNPDVSPPYAVENGSVLIDYTAATGFSLGSGLVGIPDLPVGFQITNILRNGARLGVGYEADETPNYSTLVYSLPASVIAAIDAWATDFGWSEASSPLNDAAKAAVLSQFSLSLDFSINLNLNPAVPAGSLTFFWFEQLNPATDTDTPPGVININDEYYWPIATWNDEGTPEDLDAITDAAVDPDTGEVTWTPVAGSDGTSVTLTNVSSGAVSTVTLLNPTGTYTPPNPGVYTVTLIPIVLAPVVSLGPPTTVSSLVPIIMTMSGGIDLGGSPTIQYIGDPSGIYTIVPGKTYDTLYERIPSVTSQDVKIPDPYIVTAYVGE